MKKIDILKQKVTAFTPHIPRSRVHQLKTFNHPSASCKIKRDDELGFGISGSKMRKYSSLIPYIVNHYQEAVVIGSAYSNHVLGISQLLIENKIKPILFVLGDPKMKRQGNLLLSSLLVPASQWRWITRKEWHDVETIAAEYVKNSSTPTILIPEGACMDASMPGAFTLALDILQNEEDNQEQFDHVFIDAGTGLSAIATLLAFEWLNKKTLLHILLLADSEECFLERLRSFQKSCERFLDTQIDWTALLKRFKLYRPSQAKSFGAVNKSIMDHIRFLAREEGFFTDPVYSAKLFWETKNIIKNQAIEGTVLIIHSGGALTLMGFQDKF